MTTTIKNLAELKRLIQPGVQIKTLEHFVPRWQDTTRTVTKVQTNGYWFTIPGVTEEVWTDFPKSGQVTFPAPGQFKIVVQMSPSVARSCTMEFV